MRSRLCKHCRDWHDLDAPWPDNCRDNGPQARSDLPAPMIIRDGMDATMNHADGRRYDSKRAFERAVKAQGCEIVGNEKLTERPMWTPPSSGPDIKRAIEELKSR